MKKFKLYILNEYGNAYKIKKFTKPKIYNANGNLDKRWYVYFSFLNPTTNQLERQAPVYIGVNSFKTLKELTNAIKDLGNELERALNDGFSPYEEYDNNTNLPTSINDAIDFALRIKKKKIKEKNFLKSKKLLFEKPININKQYARLFLDKVIGSNRNKNAHLISLRNLFNVLVNEDVLNKNPFNGIEKLKEYSEKHKPFTQEQITKISNHLKNKNNNILNFIRFVCYTFLRPNEVVKLKIKDINTKENLIHLRGVNAKTGESRYIYISLNH